MMDNQCCVVALNNLLNLLHRVQRLLAINIPTWNTPLRAIQ
jgi:hypothetical protein